MAEFTTARATQLAPIPDDMSFATAGVVETLSIGAQAVGRANVLEGDRVVVLGAGSIGLCCLLMARRAGAAVLVSEPLPWRRALAAEFGAERITDPADADLADAVRDFSDGYGAHVAIDATGEIEGAEAALAVAGSAARVVVLTLHDKPIRVRPWQLVRQELTLLGSRLSLADFGELVGLAASGDAPIDRLVTHTFPMSEAAAAFAAAAARPTGFVKAVVLPQE
jgi:L-gulonate 5-dehydrogenase